MPTPKQKFNFQTLLVLPILAGLALLATLPLTWSDQLIVGVALYAFCVYLNSTSKSYRVTLILILLSVFCTARYTIWRYLESWRFFGVQGSSAISVDLIFVTLLLGAETYAALILALGYFQGLKPLGRKPIPLPEDSTKWPTIDVFIPTYNEPLEIVKPTVMAEPRANSLILRAANPARVAQVRSLIEKLDQPSSALASGNIHVVYLKNAEATKLAVTLRAALTGQGGTNTPGTPTATLAQPNPTGGNTAPMGSSTATNQPSTGGQIQADPATNSLIISAPEPQYRQLRAVIDKLDQRRAQVLVESLIAEVNAEKLAQFGFQWQNVVGSSGGNLGVMGTNFDPAKIGGSNLAQLSVDPTKAAVGAGLNIAAVQSVGGVYMLGALANFLQTNGDANILSTPTLLTLDNEEAKIVVGQQVPFTTGSVVLNSAAATPFNTFERKDVGLTLRVRPQISETGTVRLSVYQEVSSIDKTTAASTGGPTTNKRSIESNVLVEDGSIVVLGGLLTDESSDNLSKVPGLGDIPFFGNLFKGQKRERSKKNLMVFLRPVVVRDGSQTDALSQSRYQQMMGLQLQSQPAPNPVLGIDGAAVLPPLPAPANTPATAPKGGAPNR